MKVLVLNGSPKGKKSVTLTYVKYLQKVFPKDSFSVLNVGLEIKAYEKGAKTEELLTAVENADFVLASYPVYTFLAPAQLHRFFEVAKDFGVRFDGKYVGQLTTSKRFYDVTAHGTIKKILADFGGKYVSGLSADMEDLTSEKGRSELIEWWKLVRNMVEKDVYEHIAGVCADGASEITQYTRKIVEAIPKDNSKRVLIVTDAEPEGDSSLKAMIDDVVASGKYVTDVFNLNEFKFKCGCLGCLKCTSSGKCAVGDGFEELLNQKINAYDAVLMAFTITNHALSAKFKMFFDRQFVNGHRPVTAGKPTGYIVSGALSKEDVLKTYIDAKSAVGGNYNCGVVSDELNTEADIRALITRLEYTLENGAPVEHNFYEVGGMKIFRDMIWIMRGLMKADYEFYKRNGLLDFPQKKRGQMILMKLLGVLVSNKKLNKKMPTMMSDGMLMPYEKVIEKATPLE